MNGGGDDLDYMRNRNSVDNLAARRICYLGHVKKYSRLMFRKGGYDDRADCMIFLK